MKVSYKGMNGALTPPLQEKLDTKFAKLAKILDGGGEKAAHVMVTNERRLYRAEITMQFYDHPLVGAGSNTDLFKALCAAFAKLEKQAVTQAEKWRGKKRRGEPRKLDEAEALAAPEKPAAAEKPRARVFRVNHQEPRKPSSLAEALFKMEDGRPYHVYRAAEKAGISILVRRRDGHFDLIES